MYVCMYLCVKREEVSRHVCLSMSESARGLFECMSENTFMLKPVSMRIFAERNKNKFNNNFFELSSVCLLFQKHKIMLEVSQATFF